MFSFFLCFCCYKKCFFVSEKIAGSKVYLFWIVTNTVNFSSKAYWSLHQQCIMVPVSPNCYPYQYCLLNTETFKDFCFRMYSIWAAYLFSEHLYLLFREPLGNGLCHFSVGFLVFLKHTLQPFIISFGNIFSGLPFDLWLYL